MTSQNVDNIYLIMSLLLASLPVSAAVCPYLSQNLVTRKWASLHDVDSAASYVELLITVTYLNQAAAIILPFMIIDDKVEFEVVFRSQWESWCKWKKGQYYMLFFSFLFSVLS